MGNPTVKEMTGCFLRMVPVILVGLVLASAPAHAGGKGDKHGKASWKANKSIVQLGPRPYYLIQDMEQSRLKRKLETCSEGPFKTSDFSIGHRGGPLQFPEHTKESYEAAARMGAGILECDVTFTKDRELVCRHSQCDLHTTTNILLTPLAAKCSEPFTPAEFDPATGKLIKPASAKCCTSDITLQEFKSLCGKMDAFDSRATTVQEFVDATANWRTDLYSTCGTVISHAESIELFNELGAKMTPELKSPSVNMPYEGDYTQEDYAQQMIDEYKAAGIPPQNVWAQSFNQGDVLYWIDKEPQFGKQAVFLDGRYNDATFDHTKPGTWNPSMTQLANNGVKIIAPPMWMLLRVNQRGKIIPSKYARAAKAAGLDIITWTLERSGPLKNGGGWYYQTTKDVINKDGDMYVVLDVLARDVGILGIFSDWPATVTYYANCMGLE